MTFDPVDPQQPTVEWLEASTGYWLERFAERVAAIARDADDGREALLDPGRLPEGHAGAMLAALLPELLREPGTAAIAMANWLSRKAIRTAIAAESTASVEAHAPDGGARATVFVLAVAFVLLDTSDDGLAAP